MKDPIDYNGVFRVSITVSVTLPEKIAQHAALFFPVFLTETCDGGSKGMFTRCRFSAVDLVQNRRFLPIDFNGETKICTCGSTKSERTLRKKQKKKSWVHTTRGSVRKVHSFNFLKNNNISNFTVRSNVSKWQPSDTFNHSAVDLAPHSAVDLSL